MANYYQIVTKEDIYPKPIVVGASAQLDVEYILRCYWPELLNEKYEIVPLPEECLDYYLSKKGENSVEFI